jgi:hypothetical protein
MQAGLTLLESAGNHSRLCCSSESILPLRIGCFGRIFASDLPNDGRHEREELRDGGELLIHTIR